jgi:hypothetical protein
VILTILKHGLKKSDRRTFLLVCSNLADRETFDEILNVPELSELLRAVIFTKLDPSLLKPALWTLSWIFERNRITGSDIIQRLLFFVAFHNDANVAALACDTITVILRVSSETIESDIRPGIGKILIEGTGDRPVIVRRAALNALYTFAYVYPDYIPLLIDHDMLRILREMLDVDNWVIQTQGLLLLDCIFGNEMRDGRSDSRERFTELNGMSIVEDLLESDNPRLSEHAEAFLLTWNAILTEPVDAF